MNDVDNTVYDNMQPDAINNQMATIVMHVDNNTENYYDVKVDSKW